MKKVALEFPDQRDGLIECLKVFSDFDHNFTAKRTAYSCSSYFNRCYIYMEMLNFENCREEYATGTLFYTVEEYRAAMDFFWACDRLDDSIDYDGRSEVKNEVIQGNPLYKDVVETARKALALLTSYKGE